MDEKYIGYAVAVFVAVFVAICGLLSVVISNRNSVRQSETAEKDRAEREQVVQELAESKAQAIINAQELAKAQELLDGQGVAKEQSDVNLPAEERATSSGDESIWPGFLFVGLLVFGAVYIFEKQNEANNTFLHFASKDTFVSWVVDKTLKSDNFELILSSNSDLLLLASDGEEHHGKWKWSRNEEVCLCFYGEPDQCSDAFISKSEKHVKFSDDEASEIFALR